MAGQGRRISDKDIRKLIHLLSSTEMTIKEIMERTGYSRAAVAAINRRFQIREYNGLRSSWSKADLDAAKIAQYLSEGLDKKKLS
jgi:hypothetical protein